MKTVFPSFGIQQSKVEPLGFADFYHGTTHVPIVPLLFSDFENSYLPANEAARFMVTIQQSLVNLETLNSLMPALGHLPQYQKYAVFGPFVLEAVSVYETLCRLTSRASRNAILSRVCLDSHKNIVDELAHHFKGEGKINLVRNNAFGHRHVILGDKSSASKIHEIISAREFLESAEFFALVTTLQRLCSELVDGLFRHSSWARCIQGVATELYLPACLDVDPAGIKEEVRAFQKFYPLVEIHPDIESRVSTINT